MRLLFFVLPVLFFASGHEAAADVHAKAITVQNPYAYATSQVQKNGAAFMVISNTADKPGKVVSAASDVAETIELHTHTMDGGVMMMREVEHYEVPAGGAVTLEPMGHHIMLIGLHAPLKEGETFPLTLNFETHEPLTIDVQIIKPGEKP